MIDPSLDEDEEYDMFADPPKDSSPRTVILQPVNDHPMTQSMSQSI